jgi:hypothetical protein
MTHEINTRTAGPLDPNETGPVAGEIVVPEGTYVYVGGTVSRRVKRAIKLNLPLDKGEVGTAYNGYNYND